MPNELIRTPSSNSSPYIPIKTAFIQRPDAYSYSTPSVGGRAHVSSHKMGSNTVKGAAAGSAFGLWGSVLGGAAGLISDIFSYKASKKAAERANKIERENTARANAAAHAEAVSARNYNSEQSQLERLRMAGLSPGLAYGNMSPSSAQPAQVSKADAHKQDIPNFNQSELVQALALLLKQQQVDINAATAGSTIDLQGSQRALNEIESQFSARQFQANIDSILSNNALTDATKNRLILMQMAEYENLLAQGKNLAANTRNTLANAEVTEKTGTRLAESEIASNKARTALAAQQEKQIKLHYDIDNQQWTQVQAFCNEFGYGELFAPIAMKAIESVANSTGTTINNVINNLTQFSGKIGDWVMDYLGLNSEFIETDTHSYNENRGPKHREGNETRTHSRKRK